MSVAVQSLSPRFPVHRPGPDARVALTTRGTEAPQLFALWDRQRRARCYGRVPQPWPAQKLAATDRQKHAIAYARRWFVVICRTAAEGARIIDRLLEIERTQRLHPGYRQYVEKVIGCEELRQILDCGSNARGGRR